MEIETGDIDGIVEEIGRQPHAVIPLLQAIQGRYNYLPEEALRRVCEISEITPAQIVGVASFYSQFRFQAGRKTHDQGLCGNSLPREGSRAGL